MLMMTKLQTRENQLLPRRRHKRITALLRRAVILRMGLYNGKPFHANRVKNGLFNFRRSQKQAFAAPSA